MGLLSKVFGGSGPKYNPVDILGSLQKYANANLDFGIPAAYQAGREQNRRSADDSYSYIQSQNNEAMRNIAEQLGLYNRGASEFSSGRAQEINKAASDFASSQALDWNTRLAELLGQAANETNINASRAGAKQAKETAEDLNLFTTLNAAYLNNEIAAPAANRAASEFNQSATDDVQSAMADMFGGQDQMDQFQSQLNANIQDHLDGKVSQSTRRNLARQAISRGATELGGDAVRDGYTGYLGLTEEQLRAQGQQQFQSLYGLYRQSVPITSGAQLFGNYALSNSQASSQANALASQLTGLGSVSAQQMMGMSGVSNQQLTGMSGLTNAQMYGTNALNASQIYGTNALTNQQYFGMNAAPVSGLLGLTTLSPAQGINFEFRNAENQASESLSRTNYGIDQGIAGAADSFSAGSGLGGGLRTGGLQGANTGGWSLPSRYQFSSASPNTPYNAADYTRATNGINGTRF